MSRVTIEVNNHDQPYTVSQMRRRLAQMLSKLEGEQPVTFSFHATLPDYKPEPGPDLGQSYKAFMVKATPTLILGEIIRTENG